MGLGAGGSRSGVCAAIYYTCGGDGAYFKTRKIGFGAEYENKDSIVQPAISGNLCSLCAEGAVEARGGVGED